MQGITPLWFLLINSFIILGGIYETFFIIPIIMSAIGIYLLEFKVKVPRYIKLLYPFAYFILYQYTIVDRSYCLVFPALIWLVSIYDKRDVKTISYFISMFVLMNTCSYTRVIAFSILCIDAFKTDKERIFNKKNIYFIFYSSTPWNFFFTSNTK